ncbi:hypothetical protein ACS0TY_024104 [Phlomoides rotata]
MFNDWAEVFGKDRAIGFGGEDVAEAYVDVDESESPNPTADQGLEGQTEFQDDKRGKRKTDMKEDQGESNVEYTKKDRVTTTSGGIQSLTLVDKLDVCEIIGAKVEWLEIFMGLPEDARPVYVHRVLDRHRA